MIKMIDMTFVRFYDIGDIYGGEIVFLHNENYVPLRKIMQHIRLKVDVSQLFTNNLKII